MKIRAWLGFLIAFAAICVGSDWIFTQLVYRTPGGDSGRIHHLYQENGDEIPIFGSSKARKDYIPSEIGFNTFNYGFEGAGFDLADVMLQIELAKHKTTPIILDMEIAAVESLGNVENYIPYIGDSRFRNAFRRQKVMAWRYYVPGIRYFGCFDWYLRPVINSRVSLTKKTVRGYTYDFSNDRVDKAGFEALARRRAQTSYGYHPDDDQNRRLIALIAAHPERLFFLVYSPYHPSCYAHFENAGAFQAFQDKLRSRPNVVLIDWGRLSYPDDYFNDTTHLVREGAEDFSRKLRDKIRETLLSRKQGFAVEKAAAAE